MGFVSEFSLYVFWVDIICWVKLCGSRFCLLFLSSFSILTETKHCHLFAGSLLFAGSMLFPKSLSAVAFVFYPHRYQNGASLLFFYLGLLYGANHDVLQTKHVWENLKIKIKKTIGSKVGIWVWSNRADPEILHFRFGSNRIGVDRKIQRLLFSFYERYSITISSC